MIYPLFIEILVPSNPKVKWYKLVVPWLSPWLPNHQLSELCISWGSTKETKHYECVCDYTEISYKDLALNNWELVKGFL